MKQPFATGQCASILDVPEIEIESALLKGKIVPPPIVVDGRRLWWEDDIGRAADFFGIKKSEAEQRLKWYLSRNNRFGPNGRTGSGSGGSYFRGPFRSPL